MPLRTGSKGTDAAAALHMRCSFCGKGKEHVRKLVAGPGVYICDQCIGLCNQVLAEEGVSHPVMYPPKPSGDDADTLMTHLRTAGVQMHQVDAHLRSTVAALRQQNVSWARIGEALGISRQAAWERFSGEE